MPAKAPPKKSTPKAPQEATAPDLTDERSPHVVPHPPIMPQMTSTTDHEIETQTEVKEEDLEAMLEEDGDESALEQKNTFLFSAGAIGTISIIVATITIFVIYLNAPKVKKEAVVREEIVPTATPTPAFVPSAISFEVFNGSGVAGAAAKSATTLTDKGYRVVGTGNAPKQATTTLLVSGSLTPIVLDGLLVDMKSLFGIGSSSGELQGATVSARLIIGTK